MSSFHDFIVKYDPKIDTKEDIAKRILYSIIIRRLKANKPVKIFISGGSGEGKSLTAIKLQELLCDIQGIDPYENLQLMNVFIPIEYPQKVKKLLYDKEHKKVNIIAMHEARDVIRAKLWQSFVTQSIADINVLSRSIKRLCIIIISQFIRDITKEVRYTLDFYCEVSRNNRGKPKLRIQRIYHDVRDLEKPVMRKRGLNGMLVYPDGTYRKFKPKYFEVSKPDKKLVELFERLDKEAKKDILENKIKKLVEEMRKEIGDYDENKKVDSILKYYGEHIDQMTVIGKYRGKSFKLNPEFVKMHDLDKKEKKDFEKRYINVLIEKGVIDESGLSEKG